MSEIVNKLSIDVSEYDMPETEKIDTLVMALAAEDEDTGKEAASYGVYAVSSSKYSIMF